MPVETEILPSGTLEGTLTFGTCAQDSIRRHSKHPASIDKPMEFDAADRQPYTEYHPDLEGYIRRVLSFSFHFVSGLDESRPPTDPSNGD